MIYNPSYSVGATKTGEEAQKRGLGAGYDILKSQDARDYQYKPDISGQLEGPATTQFAQNQGYAPMKTVAGLEGGDYTALRDALQQPIINEGQRMQNQIADQYSARGLYGSVGGGLMSGAQTQSQGATQDALSNAIANAYAVQLQDQAQQIDQNKALFSSGATTADQLNAYNRDKMGFNLAQDQQGVDFRNAVLQAQNQYGMDRDQWQTGIDEVNFQRALQLAGMGNSGAQVAAQRQMASDAADAQSTAALYGGLGSIAGGLMGSYDQSGDSGWNLSGVGDTVAGWFS